jgi:chromosome segregation ATPase
MADENTINEETREPIEEATVDNANDEQIIIDEIESSRSNICASRSDEAPMSTAGPLSSEVNDECIEAVAAAPPSTKLQELMLERIESIDAIRTLVEKELEQDSALIAEFTENVVALESEVSSKEQEIRQLTDANRALQSEMQDLKLNASTYTEELEALTSQIDKLVDDNAQLTSQNKDLTAAHQDTQPLRMRNEQMEQIISSITASLKDAKISLEKQINLTARLEKEKLHSVQHQSELRETHLRDIEAYKKRLDEAHQGQTQLRKEMDNLRSQLCDEQLKNTKLVSVQNNLHAATQSIARLNAEKAVLCEEVANCKLENEKLTEEMEKRSAMADPVKVLRKELESLRGKLADAQMENTLMGLQGEMFMYSFICYIDRLLVYTDCCCIVFSPSG